MPRKKQDETPLLARVQQAITADDYGKARAEDFIANLVASVRAKWPVAPTPPAKGKGGGGAATSITRTRRTQASGGGSTLASPPAMSSAKAAEGGNGGVPLPYAPPPNEVA